MRQHWLDIQSFLADQQVLTAIDDLAIATKFELSGIVDEERRTLAIDAKAKLAQFLRRLSDLGNAADQGVMKGVDPRSKDLVDAYQSARQDTGNYQSTLMRTGVDAVLGLLNASDVRSKRELLQCLNELRRVVERHQQTDVSAILEDI